MPKWYALVYIESGLVGGSYNLGQQHRLIVHLGQQHVSFVTAKYIDVD